MSMKEYLKELILWNKGHNLVSKNEMGNLEEHLTDSLSLTSKLPDKGLIADIGSGGGFPVIPLAFYAKEHKKDLKFIATDVIDKKIAFLRWCVMKFDLDVEVYKVDQRFLIEEPCIVVSRAFASVKNIIAWQKKHAPNTERFLLLKGDKATEELAEAGIRDFELTKNIRGFIIEFVIDSKIK